MFYKTILVHVDVSRHVVRRVDIAARLAALHCAHPVGLALSDTPQIFYDPQMFNPADLAIDAILQAPRQRAAAMSRCSILNRCRQSSGRCRKRTSWCFSRAMGSGRK